MFLFSQQREGTFSFPENASTFASKVDGMYAAIFWISFVFFVGVVAAMMYFVVKYKRKSDSESDRLPEKSPSHHTVLELTWTIVPSFILVFMFIGGAFGYLEMRTVPKSADSVERTIDVVASKWEWQFIYPNGDITNELHLAKNVPVRFRIKSKDALHSFYIREFRIKMDCVPGRYTECWVRPTKTRTPDETFTVNADETKTQGDKQPFHLQCAEYCGDNHSQMRTEWKGADLGWRLPVYVHDCSFEELSEFTKHDYDNETPWESGKHLFEMNCASCHALEDATKKVGPNFKMSEWEIGKSRTSNIGETIAFNEDVDVDNYIEESINQSSKFVVQGYPNQMPKFNFDPVELNYLRTFVKSPAADPVPGKTNKDIAEEEKAEEGQE